MTSQIDHVMKNLYHNVCNGRKRQRCPPNCGRLRTVRCLALSPRPTSTTTVPVVPNRCPFGSELRLIFLQIASFLVVVVVVVTTTTASTSHDRSRTTEYRTCGNNNNNNNNNASVGTYRSCRWNYHKYTKNEQQWYHHLPEKYDRYDTRRSNCHLSFIPSLIVRERYDRKRNNYDRIDTPGRMLHESFLTINSDDVDESDSILVHRQFDASSSSSPSSSSSSSSSSTLNSAVSLTPSLDGRTALEIDLTASTTLISKQFEVMQTVILQQQRQIDTLLNIIQQQQSSSDAPVSVVNGDSERSTYRRNPITPRLFQPLKSYDTDTSTASSATGNTNITATVQNLKAMLFIDGTWLYYSINERLSKDLSITQKYGRGWQHLYEIEWAKLPSILCNMLQSELRTYHHVNGHDSNAASNFEIDCLRSMVYTSYKSDTSTTSYRYKLFQDLKKANFSVHMMETVGRSEKCVDIQLAVEILHYATMENPTDSYDIALVLTGDKDFMPALIRTRCKGKQVALVSMRAGCNRALVDTPGLLDFDIIWMEDLLEQLLVRRMLNVESTAGLSMYTLHKVVYDFIRYSQLKRVSSRDLGRYLKEVRIKGIGKSLLDIMKKYYGGMYQYLSSMGYYSCDVPSFNPGTPDYSYWIGLHKANTTNEDLDDGLDGNERGVLDRDDNNNFFLTKPPVMARLTDAERNFFSTYSPEMLLRDRETLYAYSLPDQSEIGPSRNVINRSNSDTQSKLTITLPVIQKVIDDFVQQSKCERIASTDLQRYLDHLKVHENSSLLNEINGMYGNLLQLVKSAHYDIELDETSETYWIRLSNIHRVGNNTDQVHSSETDRNFLSKYTFEPLLQNRKWWYRDTLSTLLESSSDSNDVKSTTGTGVSAQYSKMTVTELKNVCRQMGLTVSGTKTILLERIQGYLEGNKSTVGDMNENGDLSNQMITPEKAEFDEQLYSKYLIDLVEEYLHAKGGTADSRDLGRYLTFNKSPSHDGKNALQQLKAMYGSLNAFVTKNADLFTLIPGTSPQENEGNDGANGGERTHFPVYFISLNKKST